MTNKEIARDWALQWKKDTGKFPLAKEWLVRKNKAPLNHKDLSTLFNSYNNFREYCNEPILVHNFVIPITLKILYKSTIEQQGDIMDTPCKIWQKAQGNGYPQKRIKNKLWLVHRYIHIELEGNKPEKGQTVDHICRNSSCINADHLRLATSSEQNLNQNRIKKAVKRKSNKKFPKETTLYERILYYIEKTEEQDNGCLYCSKLSISSIGYYTFQTKHKNYQLHICLELSKTNPNFTKRDYEEFTQEYITQHSCHDKKCINLIHLNRGNHKSNQIDTRNAGYSKNQKLTKEKVIEIKKLINNKPADQKLGESDKIIGNQYGVSKTTIESIRLSYTWKNI